MIGLVGLGDAALPSLGDAATDWSVRVEGVEDQVGAGNLERVSAA